MDSDERVTEHLTSARDHLDRADRIVVELASHITEVSLENPDPDSKYKGLKATFDLTNHELLPRMPIDETVNRINDHLEPPLYAAVHERTLGILNMREHFHIPEGLPDPNETEEEHYLASRVIQRFEDDTEHGASIETIVPIMNAVGFEHPRQIITELRNKGVVEGSKAGFITLSSR